MRKPLVPWEEGLLGLAGQDSNLRRTGLEPAALAELSYGPLRVIDGIRTRNHRDHNAALYQLSYDHSCRRGPVGFEPTAGIKAGPPFTSQPPGEFPFDRSVPFGRSGTARVLVAPAGFEPAT